MTRLTTASRVLLLSVSIAALSVSMNGQQSDADNTKQNKAGGITATDQKNDAADRATTQKIRKALIADKSLSSYAHNIKIITVNGTVALRGPVRSEEEKAAIESKAAEIAGAGQRKKRSDRGPAQVNNRQEKGTING